jgi:hypothetical protein
MSEELMQLWKSHAHALFGRIQNQSAIFTEADREELMDFANKVATGGMLFAALQEGGRRWVAKLRKSENARDGKSKKAAAWHVTVEALAVKLWVERPNFRDNADKTAAEIYDALTVTCPSAPNQRSVAKYISRADVREQLNKNVCSSN